MSKTLRIVLIIIFAAGVSWAAVFFFMSSGLSANAKLIPEDASMVISVRPVQLFEKAEIKKVRKMAFMNQFMSEMTDRNADMKEYIDDILANPSITGIDYTTPVYFFLCSRGGMDDKYGALTVKVENEAQFEKFVRRIIPPEKYYLKNEERYTYVTPDRNTIIAWDGEKAMFMGGDREKTLKIADELMLDDKNEFNISENRNFRKFIKSKHDIGMFVNFDKLMPMFNADNGVRRRTPDMNTPFRLQAAGYSDDIDAMRNLYKGLYLQTLLNFDNDKIIFTATRYYADNDAEERMKKLEGKGLDKDIMKAVSPEHIIAVAAESFNMETVFDMLKRLRVYNEVFDNFSDKTGLSKSKLSGLFTGNVIAALIDFKRLPKREKDWSMMSFYPPPPPYGSQQNYSAGSYRFTMPYGNSGSDNNTPVIKTDSVFMPVFTATAGLADRKSAEAALAKILKSRNKMYIYEPETGFNFYCVFDRADLTVTNDSAVAAELSLKQEFKEPEPGISKLINGKNAVFYADLEEKDLPEHTRSSLVREEGLRGYNKIIDALAPFKNAILTSDGEKTTFTINMKETRHNSLYTILNHIDEEMH